MIISQIKDGLGNQLFRYAAGRRLAHKLGTEFKIDTADYAINKFRLYVLDQFNITATIATPEEIARLKKFSANIKSGMEKKAWQFMPEVLNWSDNLYLVGAWEDERYFADIADILRQEFTLKNSLGATAQHWKEKILATEYSVSIHVRHGDVAYSPFLSRVVSHTPLPLDYYHKCIEQLRQLYENITLFVFTNNVQWVKKNLRAGVSTEFVSGEGLTDVEELYLMNTCQHNVIANSTFSWWGAWLNQNPDKKVFMPIPSDDAAKVGYRFSAERNENSPLESDRWIRVPFNVNRQPDITQKPYFSLLLVVNDDAATIQETLGTVLSQNYKFYELIIIDNASTDGSDKFCRQAAQISAKVTLISLYDKISDGAAWNKALDVAQGNYIMFLKGNDRFINNALLSMYLTNEHIVADIVHSVKWLKENEHGYINLAGRKFSVEVDAPFRNLQGNVRGQFDKPTILKVLSETNTAPLAAKIFKRKFLTDNGIQFDKKNDGNDAELFFTIEAMLKAHEIIFTPTIFFVAPKDKHNT